MDTTLLKKPVAVLGAGAWGTALAIQLARNHNQPVRLWTHRAKQAQAMIETQRNMPYLPDHCLLPNNISIYYDLKQCLDEVKDIVIVVPSPAFYSVLLKIKPYLSKETRLIWGTKGFPVFDQETSDKLHPTSSVILLHDAVQHCVNFPMKAAVLSGPSFAIEVAENLPTAVVIASLEADTITHWSQRFHSPAFRVYGSNDVIGVELGGILKNIMAVAAGAAAGLKLGHNARSALITRGLAEMLRFTQTLGAQQETLIGLSGLGDLILTATSDQSRNYRFGFALGSGLTTEQAKSAAGAVIESVNNVVKISNIAQEKHIDMPITTQVEQLMLGKIQAKEALTSLLNRAPSQTII